MKKDTVIVFPLRVFLGGGRRGGAPSVECGERSLETMAQQETSPDLEAKPPRLPGPPPREWEGEGESRVQEQKEEEREGAPRTRRNREEATGQLRGVGQQLGRREGLQDCLPSSRSSGACASSAAARGRDGALLVLLRLVEI